MRIPTAPGLGQRIAQPILGQRPSGPSGAVPAALDRLGNTVQNIALQRMGDEQRQAEIDAHEARRLAEYQDRQRVIAERAQAAVTFAQLESDAADIYGEVSQGVLDGSIKTSDAEKTLSERIAKARDSRLEGITPLQRGVIADNIVRQEGNLRRKLGEVVSKRRQGETTAAIDGFIEQQQRIAAVDPAKAVQAVHAMVDFAAPGAAINPEQAGKLKQRFSETAYYLHFDRQGTDALTRNDSAGIGEVIKRVRGAEGEAMDPARRTQLIHQLHGWQKSIEAKGVADAEKQFRAQEAREADALKGYDEAVGLTMKGQFLSPEYIKRLTVLTSGTRAEGAVAELLDSQVEVAGFASRSAPERTAALEQMRARGATRGVGTSPERAKFLGEMERVDAGLRQAFKENPWQAAQSAGVIERAPELDVSSPSALLGSLQTRQGMASKLEVWGGEKISLLQPTEADRFAKFARSLPFDQAASLLGEAGRVIGDSERIAALGKQIHDKDGALGLAMGFASTQTSQGRYAAELVLRGDQAIRDKAIKVDGMAESGWKATIARTIRGAYANREVENRVVDAAFLIAAAKDGDLETAVSLATGGGVIDFNGSKVPMPVGYASDGGQSGAESRFRKEIEKLDPAQLFPQITDGKVYMGQTSIPASEFFRQLPKAQLMHAGQGAYWVKAGNTLASNQKGEPIVIRIPVGK